MFDYVILFTVFGAVIGFAIFAACIAQRSYADILDAEKAKKQGTAE